jgi:hypothetical protein
MADGFFSSSWRMLEPYGCAEPDYLVGRSELCLDKQIFARYWSVTYGTVGYRIVEREPWERLL